MPTRFHRHAPNRPRRLAFSARGHAALCYAGDNPFGFSALDIKSFAMAVLGCEFRQTTKRHMPREWFAPDLPHTHVALDDALEQGALFLNLLRASRERGG